MIGWDVARSARPVVGVLRGEGIGSEVLQVALDVLEAAAPGLFEMREGGAIGGMALRQHGAALTEEVKDFCQRVFDDGGAILCGPGGGRFVYDLRVCFDLYCKLTPLYPSPALATVGALVAEARRTVDIVVVREIRGGLYTSPSRRVGDEVVHELSYHRDEVRRILEVAARLASLRRGHLAVALKPGGLPELSVQWGEVLTEVAEEAGVASEVYEVDNLAYQLIARARDFDVIAAPNLFGDILADAGALLLGSRGMSFSGNFGAPGVGVYQTGHGAAHDLAGRGVANPIGQLLATAMMLRESFAMDVEASAIETAVEGVLAAGIRTPDVAIDGCEVVGTAELGRHVVSDIREARQSGATVP